MWQAKYVFDQAYASHSKEYISRSCESHRLGNLFLVQVVMIISYWFQAAANRFDIIRVCLRFLQRMVGPTKKMRDLRCCFLVARVARKCTPAKRINHTYLLIKSALHTHTSLQPTSLSLVLLVNSFYFC